MKKILIASTICLSLIIVGCSRNTSPSAVTPTPVTTTKPDTTIVEATTAKAVTPATATTPSKPATVITPTTTAKPATVSTPAASVTPTSTTSTSLSKDMTLDQLKKYNGQNGNPAYVAVSGVIYDVTNAQGWRNGKHKSGISAGSDLTQQIQSAPHGTSVLNGLPVIG